MTEDIMVSLIRIVSGYLFLSMYQKNFDGLNSLYRKQRSSQISPMMSPTTVLPRFDSPMTSSSTTRWLPAPLNENPYEKKSVDPVTTTYALTRTSDQLPPSNAYPKASDQWRPSYGYPKTSDQWSPINNAYSKTNTQQSANNSFTRPMNSPMMSNNASNAKMINRFEEDDIIK
jgi:hypothetical protein